MSFATSFNTFVSTSRQPDQCVLESYQKELNFAHELIKQQEFAISSLEEKLHAANAKIFEMEMKEKKDEKLIKELFVELNCLKAHHEENLAFFDTKNLDANKTKLITLKLKNKNLKGKLENSENLMREMKRKEEEASNLVEYLALQVEELEVKNKILDTKCVRYERQQAVAEYQNASLSMDPMSSANRFAEQLIAKQQKELKDQKIQYEKLNMEIESIYSANQLAQDSIRKKKEELEIQKHEIYQLKNYVFEHNSQENSDGKLVEKLKDIIEEQQCDKEILDRDVKRLTKFIKMLQFKIHWDCCDPEEIDEMDRTFESLVERVPFGDLYPCDD